MHTHTICRHDKTTGENSPGDSEASAQSIFISRSIWVGRVGRIGDLGEYGSMGLASGGIYLLCHRSVRRSVQYSESW
jgi:hypothetical protein